MISNKTPVFISTDREDVMLRELMSDDAVALFGLIDRSREHLALSLREKVKEYLTPEAVAEGINNPKDPLRLRLGIWHRDGQTLKRTLVGVIYLSPITPPEASVSFWVGEQFLLHGYASCALRAVTRYTERYRPYIRMLGVTDDDNLPGQRVLLTCGFRGVMRVRRNAVRVYLFELDWRTAFASIVHDLEAGGRAAFCAPVGDGYPHHTIAELLHEGNRVVRFFPPRNGALIALDYRDALARRLVEARWQLE